MIKQKPILHLFAESRVGCDPCYLIARFWRKVHQPDEGCWTWKAAIRLDGYGVVVVRPHRFAVARQLYAHRVAWVLHHKRDIPEGMVIDHLCANKSCCNPAHLDCVTQTQNVDRYHSAKPRTGLCKRGHAIETGKHCKTCRDAQVAAWYAAHPNAKREQSQRYEAKRSAIRKAATRARQSQP